MATPEAGDARRDPLGRCLHCGFTDPHTPWCVWSENAALRAEMDALREALEAAAKSLAWIAGRKPFADEALHDVYWEIRGYAESRATEARAALEEPR